MEIKKSKVIEGGYIVQITPHKAVEYIQEVNELTDIGIFRERIKDDQERLKLKAAYDTCRSHPHLNTLGDLIFTRIQASLTQALMKGELQLKHVSGLLEYMKSEPVQKMTGFRN